MIPVELETVLVRVSQVSKLFACPSAQMSSGTGLDTPEAIYQTEKRSIQCSIAGRDRHRNGVECCALEQWPRHGANYGFIHFMWTPID